METNDTLTLDLPAALDSLAEATNRTRAFLVEHGDAFSEPGWLYNVELVISELCTNIARHAYAGTEDGTMRVEVMVQENAAVLRFTDWGRPFDPEAVPEPDFDTPVEGGRGIFIVRQLAETMHYESADGANTMTVWIGAPQ